MCCSSMAPPAVTTAAARSVTTWPVPASAPSPTTAPEPATPPAAVVAAAVAVAPLPAIAPLPAAAPPPPPMPSSLAMTPIGPSAGTNPASWRLTPAHLAAELPAVGAVAQVPAGQSTGAHAPVVGDDQILADAGARGVAGLAGLSQSDARAHEQRLDRGTDTPSAPATSA